MVTGLDTRRSPTFEEQSYSIGTVVGNEGNYEGIVEEFVARTVLCSYLPENVPHSCE